MVIEKINTAVNKFEKELGLSIGFMESIKNDSDWSFVIKIHALLEVAVSTLLTKSLGREELRDIFSTMELSNKRHGKIAFAKAIKVLDKPYRRFINSFSELRNDLVHNIKNINFDFKNYVKGLSSKDFDIFLNDFDPLLIKNLMEDQNRLEELKDYYKNNPKDALWLAAMGMIEFIYNLKEINIKKNFDDALLREVGRRKVNKLN